MNEINLFYRHNNPIVEDALDRVVVKILHQREQEGHQSFLFSGCEPLVGTTSLAISLAIAMASAGWNTVLVDAVLRKPADYKRLKNETGLTNYLKGLVPLENTIYPTNRHQLFYIPSGELEVLNPVRLLCSSRLTGFLAELKTHYDFVIIDSPSQGAVVDAEILARNVDTVVLVAQWDRTKTKRITQAKHAFEEAGGQVSGIVVNRMDLSDYSKHSENHNYFADRKYPPARGTQYAATTPDRSTR